MAQNVMTNRVWRSKWTAKDYDDVKRAQTQLQQQLLPMNAAAMAKAIKAWLSIGVPLQSAFSLDVLEQDELESKLLRTFPAPWLRWRAP